MVDLVAVVHNRLEPGPKGGKQLADHLRPSGDEYDLLRRRAEALVSALMPGDRQAMLKAIVFMFFGFPSVKVSEDVAAKQGALYVSQVMHLPLWAISEGCRRALARDTAWPPSAGEFRALCEAAVGEFRQEKARIDAILDADVYRLPAPEDRDAVTAGFAKLLRDLGTHTDFGRKHGKGNHGA